MNRADVKLRVGEEFRQPKRHLLPKAFRRLACGVGLGPPRCVVKVVSVLGSLRTIFTWLFAASFACSGCAVGNRTDAEEQAISRPSAGKPKQGRAKEVALLVQRWKWAVRFGILQGRAGQGRAEPALLSGSLGHVTPGSFGH